MNGFELRGISYKTPFFFFFLIDIKNKYANISNLSIFEDIFNVSEQTPNFLALSVDHYTEDLYRDNVSIVLIYNFSFIFIATFEIKFIFYMRTLKEMK